MFSKLGPLFRTTFRQAESNDTRQHIPHQEIDKARRKQEDSEKKLSDDELWEDNTIVTVPALRTFLINFMKTLPEAENQDFSDIEKPPTDPIKARPHEQIRPTNTQNAKAVRAYQSMAAQSATSNTTDEQNQNLTYRRPPSADMVKSKELRDIYSLIDDLDIIERHGIKNLTIIKAGTFIESLKKAVLLAKSKI